MSSEWLNNNSFGASDALDLIQNVTDGSLVSELFKVSMALDDHETSTIVVKSEKLYFGRMTLHAFIIFCIGIPLLLIITIINCYWDFEYERCCVEPADEKQLPPVPSEQISESVSKKDSKGVSTSTSAVTKRGHHVVSIDVEDTQCSSPPVTMDMTQQVSEGDLSRLKRARLVAAAYSISTSRSERIREDGTQSESTSETGVSPADSMFPSTDASKSGRILITMKSETKTPEPNKQN